MQVRIEEVSPVEKKLIVEVPWAAVSDRLGESYRELGKSVQLKGFRKGKVPRSVLEQMFGKRVRSEVAGQLVRESFVTAVTEHKLEAVSEPRVEEELTIKRGQPFTFEAIVEVKGDVVAKDYGSLELTRRPLAVSDDAVEHALKHLQREHTDLHPIEDREQLETSDLAVVSLKGTLGEHEVDRPSITVDLGDTDHEPLPGLAAALVGMSLKASDQEIEITVPEDYRDESIAGVTGKFMVSVLDARAKDVPDLDDEFAKDTGKADSLDGLRAALRQDLENKAKEEIDEEVRQAALAELVKRNQIPVAPSLTERVVANKWQRLQSMFGGMEMPMDGLDDDLRKSLGEGAEDEVRGQLLLESVAELEKIEITDEEIDERITRLAEQMGQPMARLRAEMDRDGRLDDVRFTVRREKTLDLLVERATVVEKEPEEPAPGGESADGASDDSEAEGA